jgi:hypothetical protein
MSTTIPIQAGPQATKKLSEAFASTALPVEIPRGFRRIWQPWELEMGTVGADNRYRLWRYIMPGTDAVLTKFYSFEGCEDITVWIETGDIASGTPTITAALCIGMQGGSDVWSNIKDVTPTGTDYNVVTTSTAARHLIVSTAFVPSPFDATTTTNWKSQMRGITPNFWALSLTANAANVPVTVWAVGR